MNFKFTFAFSLYTFHFPQHRHPHLDLIEDELAVDAGEDRAAVLAADHQPLLPSLARDGGGLAVVVIADVGQHRLDQLRLELPADPDPEIAIHRVVEVGIESADS